MSYEQIKSLVEKHKEMAVVKVMGVSSVEEYLLPRGEYEKKSDEFGVKVIDFENKNGLKKLVGYVRDNGLKFTPTPENWELLGYPIPVMLYWRFEK